jgi:sodium-dependent phosphate transporter
MSSHCICLLLAVLLPTVSIPTNSPSWKLAPDLAARLVKEDHRIRFGHVLLGPLLWKEDGWLPFPKRDVGPLVPDYYVRTYHGEGDPYAEVIADGVEAKPQAQGIDEPATEITKGTSPERESEAPTRKVEASELQSVDTLPLLHPKRLFVIIKYVLLRGVTKDVIGHQSRNLAHVHARAPRYDNKVEHLWTAAQVTSAIIMSIAHGSNDVSNAIGPWTTEYLTWKTGTSSATVDTPTWIRAVGGLGLAIGFWTYGYHLMRNLGNKITQMSPTRGYSMELGTAITVLLASRLGLPISTTQCITGKSLALLPGKDNISHTFCRWYLGRCAHEL